MRKIIHALASSIFLMSTFNLKAYAEGEIIVLPDTVTGEYVGTVLWGPTPKVSQNAIATVTRGVDQKLVKISFAGGIPGADESTPVLKNFQFRAVSGSQIGVYESVSVDQSLAGVQLSASMTNMNIVNVVINGVKIEFTGMKRK